METRSTRGALVFANTFLPILFLAGGLATLSGRCPLDSVVVLLIVRFVLLGFERACPNQERWNYPLWQDWKSTAAELGADLMFWTCLTWFPFSVVMRPVKAAVASVGASLGLAIWPSSQPLAVKALLFLLAGECCTYWYHRISHRTRVFWQFHSVHHMPNSMNCFKNDRNHVVDVLCAGLSMLPLVFLGAKPPEALAALTFGEIVALAAHANIRVKSDWLAYLFVTPNYHLRHHSVVLGESNSNFGCRITLYDRIFGSWRKPISDGEVAGHEVGVLGEAPNGFLRQLLRPFFRRIGEPASS